MGEGNEPTPRLDAATIKRINQQIIDCTTRTGLDHLTRLIWRTYETPLSGINTKALEQLKARIKAQRDIIARNDPR